MTRAARQVLGVVLILLGSAALSGCIGPDVPSVAPPTPDLDMVAVPDSLPCPVSKSAIAVAVSGRAGSPMPVLDADDEVVRIVAQALRDSSPEGGVSLSVVNVDGEPSEVWSGRFTSDAHPEATAAVDDDRVVMFDAFFQAAVGVRADSPQVDVLQALGLAAREGSDTSIVLVDSALQTVAPLDFTRPGVLDARPTDTVAFLRRAGRLPVLKGHSVFLSGVGDTARPQEPLGESRRLALVEMWSEILKASGACVAVLDKARSGASPADVPEVTPVPVPAAPVFTPGAGAQTVFGDGTLGFKVNSPDLRSPDEAENILRPIADYLAQDPSRRILLVGTTACDGKREGRLRLSEQRAKTVTDVLVGLGARPEQIYARGVGTDFPQYTFDRAGNDVLAAEGAMNRTVRVTDLPPGSTAADADAAIDRRPPPVPCSLS